MSKEPEVIVQAPPFVQACRCIDHLWMAANALSHINRRKADTLWHEVEDLKDRVIKEILPLVMKPETLG